MKKKENIDPSKEYTLGEIVRANIIAGADTIPKVSRIVRNDLMGEKVLKGKMVKRGVDGVQWKVKGENIIKYLDQKYEQQTKRG